MFHKCEKCGKDYAERTKLIGGYLTYLCADCQNKFTEFMFHKELVKLKVEWGKLETIIEINKERAKRTYSNYDLDARQVWENQTLRIEEIYTKMYESSKDWCRKEE